MTYLKRLDYIHRIGRTGRYDKTGIAVTLVVKKDIKLLKPIQEKVGNALEIIDGDAILEVGPDAEAKPSPKTQNKEQPKANKNTSTKKKDSKLDIRPDFLSCKKYKGLYQ